MAGLAQEKRLEVPAPDLTPRGPRWKPSLGILMLDVRPSTLDASALSTRKFP